MRARYRAAEIRVFYRWEKEESRLKILVIDGQGGGMGKLLIERLRSALPDAEIAAVGTNSIATAVMLKAGADYGATGENPVVVACRDADVITGPVGIVVADALYGEVTPAMAAAIGASPAVKVLLPYSKCRIRVAGKPDLPLQDAVNAAVDEIRALGLA